MGGVDCTVVLLEDKALACRVVGRCHPVSEGRPTIDLFTASLGCFREDQTVVCHCGEDTHPTAGQPRFPLWIESASRLLIVLVIMRMQFGRINAFNEMCAGFKVK
jgi:hypothetical protein